MQPKSRRKTRYFSLAVLCVATFALGQAQTPGEHRVNISVQGEFRHITSNGIPDHETGKFPNRGNPNSIRAQDYKFTVPLKPKASKERRRAGGPTLFGVALSGVVFDPGTAEFWNNDRDSGWNYEAIGGHIDLGLDKSNGHVQPSGAYHYHGPPTALIEKLVAAGPGKAVPKQMTLVGWAADGYPIYNAFGHTDARDAKSPLKKLSPSYRLKSGTRPAEPDGPGGKFDGTFTADFEYVAGAGDLDECNGREGVTPEFPEGTYYYVLTDTFPWVPRRFHGEPDKSFDRPRPPGEGPGGRGPGGRRGPRPPPPR